MTQEITLVWQSMQVAVALRLFVWKCLVSALQKLSSLHVFVECGEIAECVIFSQTKFVVELVLNSINTKNYWKQERILCVKLFEVTTQPENICKSQRTNQCHSIHTMY